MNKNLNLANAITLFRLLVIAPLSVFFLVTGSRTYFLIAIIALFALDNVDGRVARKLNQVTQLGKFLDGATDTLGIFIVLAYLYFYSIIDVVKLGIIVFPRVAYYIIVYYIQFKNNKLIQTYLWKAAFGVWELLFIVLIFIGYEPISFAVLNAAVYGLTTWHFVVVIRKLYFKAESKMIAE